MLISPLSPNGGSYVSEVGGSEFAFRQAPPNREIVSCRACVRACARSGCLVGSLVKCRVCGFSLLPFPSPAFPFPF